MTDEWTDLHTDDHGDTIDHTGRIVNDDGAEPHGPMTPTDQMDKHTRDVDERPDDDPLIAAAQALTDKIAAYGLPPEYLIDEWRALRSAIARATGRAQP